jgi:murein DD-endopeptidase MepM/ murein hydrolase activator NlpD
VSGFGGMDAAAALSAGPLGNDDAARLRGKKPEEVAKEFEVLLVAQMIGEMRKTVPDSELLSASPERKMLDGVYDQEIARSLVVRGDFGVAKQLVAQLRLHGERGANASSGADAANPGASPTSGASALLGAPSSLVSPLADASDVTSDFGRRLDPITGEPAFHAGIDLAAPQGAEVRAVAAGRVVFSGERGRAGNLVEVQHGDGSVSSYAHLDRRLVSEGAQVAAGSVLGTVGSTGRTTGPHLHFALEQGGAAVDPSGLLKRILGAPAATRRGVSEQATEV